MQVINIVEYNPIVWLRSIHAHMKEGFRVVRSIEGYPVYGTLCQVQMFRQEGVSPEIEKELDGNEVIVQEWDVFSLLMGMQNAFDQGFRIDVEDPHFANMNFALKSVKMVREGAEKQTEEKSTEVAKEVPVEEVQETESEDKPKTRRRTTKEKSE
ncbi:hypothetical protein PaSzw1_6 [Pseudomonas phage PaSzW-1]|uniref:Uncharacterized protein n=1 Tax=Pseudomonas phage PaZq-1 TaxID=2419747 RepID=A0A411BDU5_9CAUD|nr:hypothetical protein QE326_gp045 [Pseudomonas phage PaZq-1]QAX99790.1 hypothetical protein [Pseudomonas phage PaZq-1]QAY01573.1 hypothetical protein PaSzw1_6 [Pseudomonas phage PaSzW-1]